MMGNSRTNEKDKPPASANPLLQLNNDYTKSIAPNMHSVSGLNVVGAIPDMSVAPGWENMCLMNQSIAQGIPETSGSPMTYFMNPNSFQNSQFQNPQLNLIPNTANTNIPEVPLIPEWNMRWNPQIINQEHNVISGGGMNDGSGISSFENPWASKNPTTARNFVGDSQMSTKFAPFNRPQVNADILGSSLSFGPRDTATIHTRNNPNFNSSQCGIQGKVEGSFLSLGIGGTDETITRPQTGNREISGTLRDAAEAELKAARARRAMGQTLDAGFMGLQRNISGFSNQLSHIDRMTLTNNEVGVQCTLNSGPGSSPYHTLQMQQYGDLDHHYRAFVGNQAAHSGTLGGNSAQFFNPQQYDLNGSAPESSKPSWIASHIPSGQLQNIRFTTVNSLPSESSTNSPSLGLGSSSTQQNYAGQQLISRNGMSTQGIGGSLFPQRIAAPQVGWVSSGQAATDAPFPKRLGVELIGKDSPQVAERHLRGTTLQTTNTGQICQFPDKGSNYLPDHLLQRSIDRSVGTPVNYPLNSQEPFSAHGQSQDSLIQLPKDPRGATSINASTVDGLSQKSDSHMRPSHKRAAVANPPATHWVQRQKITHPTVHHSIPIPLPTKPATIPGTTALVHPSIPGTSHFKARVPVKAVPIVAHIAWKDPDGTPKLTGYKCLLCKRDLSLTSEGAVYQPVPPPPVAVLPCGHTFHDQCLQNITPQDQSKDPPCIPCAIGDN